MRVMMCLFQGGLHSSSASSGYIYVHLLSFKMAVFREVADGDHKYQNNFRPVQPLGDRKVINQG